MYICWCFPPADLAMPMLVVATGFIILNVAGACTGFVFVLLVVATGFQFATGG